MCKYRPYHDLTQRAAQVQRRGIINKHVEFLAAADEPKTIEEVADANDVGHKSAGQQLIEMRGVWLCRDRIETGEVVYSTPEAWVTADDSVTLHDDPDCDHLGVVEGHRPATDEDLAIGEWCDDCDPEPAAVDEPLRRHRQLVTRAKGVADD